MKPLADSFLRDRRISKRYNIKTALRVRMWKSPIPEQRAESINLSDRGIFFATNHLFYEGEAIEILLKMPQEISGELPTEWRCTGLVVRVQPVDSPKGKLGVGVRFECYEVSRASPAAELESRVPQAASESPFSYVARRQPNFPASGTEPRCVSAKVDRTKML